MFKILVLTCALCTGLNTFAQDTTAFKAIEKKKSRHTLSGFITDEYTGERLIGAVVYETGSNLGTVTNSFGFYSLTLPEGDAVLRVTYVGYQTENVRLNVSADRSLSFKLKTAELQEVEIVGSKEKRIEEKSQMSSITIPVDQIKSLPRFMGEVDVLKAIQLLPGVQSGVEGTSGFYVRGGSADQNLILLDGVPVYNASHLFGFFSVFNGEALNNVTLIKGGFPARYGGRLSSVVDITTRDGNQNKLKGNINVGLISSSIALDGPVIKDKSTFVIAARRTYIDVLATPLIMAATNGQRVGYYFYDMNAKYTHKINDKTKVYASFYGGNDKFYANMKEGSDKAKAGMGWGNIAAVVRLNRQHHPKLFGNYSLIYSRYKFNIKTEYDIKSEDATFYANYFSLIKDITAKAEYDFYASPLHRVRFGGNTTAHLFMPGAIAARNESNGDLLLDTALGLTPKHAQESYLFFEDEMDITRRFQVNLGLHYSNFFVDDTSYHSLQPRISGRYSITEKVSLKASYAKMAQYIHLLSNAGIGLPTDLWVPVTKKVSPQLADQVAVGMATTLGKDYELSVEAYHKTMQRIIEYRDGESYMDPGKTYEDKVTSGTGWCYGAEVFFQKKYGRSTGWIGYTLAWSNRSFREIDNQEIPLSIRQEARHQRGVQPQVQRSHQPELYMGLRNR